MKHGSGSEEHLHSSSSISPCSPGLPQLWEVSMANKGGHMHPNSYMNSFGHWYPNHPPHQDAMPRPQMMWVLCFWFHAGQMLGPSTSTPTPSTRVIKTLDQNYGAKTSSGSDITSIHDIAEKLTRAMPFYPTFFCAWLDFIAKQISENWSDVLQIKACRLDVVCIYVYIFVIYPRSWKVLKRK